MNLLKVNFNTKSYSSNNNFSNNGINSNKINNNQHLFKSINGQYYENYDEVRKQNNKVFQSFGKPNKK